MRSGGRCLREPRAPARGSGDRDRGGPGRADHLYTTAQLREDFASLQIVELREFEADLAEGRGHCGRSALVGLVARKP